MKVQHIQTVVAIADAGSLRGAAKALRKSQPALTKSLRQAEDALGVPIFQRSSRGVVPTEMGEHVLVRARSISSEIKRLDDEIAQLRGEQVGSVHVCVSPLAAVKILPQALSRFHSKFPDVETHLTGGLYPNALKPLRDGRTDLVIGPTPPARMLRDINVEPLLATPIALITSKNSPYKNAQSLSELLHARWIMIGAPLGPGDIFRKLFIDKGLTPPKATTTSESYFGAVSLIEELGAVCVFPLKLLENVQKSSDIVRIDVQDTFDLIEISLMTRSGHPLTPMADALANAIRRRTATIRHES